MCPKVNKDYNKFYFEEELIWFGIFPKITSLHSCTTTTSKTFKKHGCWHIFLKIVTSSQIKRIRTGLFELFFIRSP